MFLWPLVTRQVLFVVQMLTSLLSRLVTYVYPDERMRLYCFMFRDCLFQANALDTD